MIQAANDDAAVSWEVENNSVQSVSDRPLSGGIVISYSIGALSDLFGLSPQAIHLYEKMGLIQAYRDGSNGYRYFDGFGFQCLGMVRKLRNAGYSLKDSARIHDRTTETAVYEEYRRQKKRLDREIEERRLIAARLEEYAELLERLWLQRDGFETVRRGACYRLEIDDDQLVNDPVIRDMASRWFSSLFHTSASLRFERDGKRFSGYRFGVIASGEVFRQRIHQTGPGVTRIEAGMFARRVFKYLNRVDMDSMQRATTEFLDSSGHTLRYDPVTRLAASFSDPEGNRVNVAELLLPLA